MTSRGTGRRYNRKTFKNVLSSSALISTLDISCTEIEIIRIYASKLSLSRAKTNPDFKESKLILLTVLIYNLCLWQIHKTCVSCLYPFLFVVQRILIIWFAGISYFSCFAVVRSRSVLWKGKENFIWLQQSESSNCLPLRFPFTWNLWPWLLSVQMRNGNVSKLIHYIKEMLISKVQSLS